MKSATTNLEAILSLKEKISKISEELERAGYEEIKNIEKYKPQRIGSVISAKAKEPRNIVFIDAGSQEISLAIDSIYLISALAINQDGEKKFKGPYIKTTPEIKEEEYIDKEGYLRVRDVVSLIRENMIFQLAIEAMKENPDIIVIDGPLIIRDAFIRYSGLKAFENFLNSVKELGSLSVEKNIPIIGFVKRPQSKFYVRTKNFPRNISDLRDPVFLDVFLRKGDNFPDPPITPEVKSFKDVSSSYFYTYFKTQEKSIYPPFRIDFNSVAVKNYREWLKWLLKNSGPSTDGIPYMLDKVDKEVKMKEILSNQLYKEMRRKIPLKLKYLCKLKWGEKIE